MTKNKDKVTIEPSDKTDCTCGCNCGDDDQCDCGSDDKCDCGCGDSSCECGCDSDCEENIITLVTDTGEEVDFLEIAGVIYKEEYYSILQPVNPMEGMNEEDVLVFKVAQAEDGENTFTIETDEAVLDGVFQEYQKLIDEAQVEE